MQEDREDSNPDKFAEALLLTTSGLDLPLLCRLSYDERKVGDD